MFLVFSPSHKCITNSGLSHVAVDWEWAEGSVGGFFSFVFNGGRKYIAMPLQRVINDEFK